MKLQTILTYTALFCFCVLPCLCREASSDPAASCHSLLQPEDGQYITQAKPDSRPWMVLIWVSCEARQLPAKSVIRTCEGAIVNVDWVLTAGTCFRDCSSIKTSSVVVDIGLHSSDIRKEISNGRKNTQRISIDKVYSSKDDTAVSDIEELSFLVGNMSSSSHLALLHLSSSVKGYNRVISLPDCTKPLVGSTQDDISPFESLGSGEEELIPELDKISNFLASSWGGLTSKRGVLQDVRSKLLSEEECNEISGGGLLPSGLLCARTYPSEPFPFKESQGDTQEDCVLQAGAPLVRPQDMGFTGTEEVVKTQCEWTLTGLLSFGMGCHGNNDITPEEPESIDVTASETGYFVNVCHHLPWIKGIIEQYKALTAVTAACPILPQPPTNGYICNRRGNSPLTVEVCCDRGYKLQGRSKYECDSVTGIWKPEDGPLCVPIQCPPLLAPPHSHTYPTPCNDTVYHSTCWIVCDHGYILSEGDGLLTCTDKGTWSTGPPNCIPVDCGPPPSGGSLLVSYTSMLVNSTAIYTCSHCYAMVGGVNESVGGVSEGVEMVCDVSGAWTGPKPFCKPTHCPSVTSPDFGFAHLTSLQCGAKVRYSCEPGLKLIGQSEAECLSNGTWSTATPQCTPIACDAPKIPWSNFAHSNTSYAFGSMISVECDRCRVGVVEGVEVGVVNLTCAAEGKWDQPLPSCQWATCPLPQLLDNGLIDPIGQLYFCGTKVQFLCRQGYRLNGTGTNTSTCTVNGTWTEEFPTCEKIPVDYCLPPPAPQNHTHFCGSKIYRNLHSIVLYCCDEGYKFVSGVISMGAVRCEESGEWNGTVPLCEPVRCPVPSLPEGVLILHAQLQYTQGQVYNYGSKSASDFDYGTRLTLDCGDTGSTVSGPKHLTCGVDGEWDHSVPSCEATRCSIACEGPFPPRNGRVVSIIRPGVGILPRTTGFKGAIVGDVSVFVCNYGYNLHGSGSRRCGSDGVWSGQAPLCLKTDQPRSRFIFRNRVNVTEWETADSAHFLSGDTIYLGCQVNIEGMGKALPIRKIDGPPLDTRNTRSRAYGSPSRSTRLAIQPRNGVGGHTMAGVYLCEVQSNSSSSIIVGKTLTIHVHDVFCPIIYPPRLGKLVTMGTTPGSCLHYECNRGYSLIGANDRICLNNGTWSGPSEGPECVLETD